MKVRDLDENKKRGLSPHPDLSQISRSTQVQRPLIVLTLWMLEIENVQVQKIN